MDMNARHAGFVMAAYAITAILLALLIGSTLRNAKKRKAELLKLEAEALRRRQP